MPAQARIMIRPPSETTPMPNGVHAQSPSSWVGMIHLGMIHGLQCYCRQHGWVDRDLSSDQTSVLVRHQFWSDINATTRGFALFCRCENRGCSVGIIQVAHVPQQARDGAMKLCQQLLAHGQFGLQ